MVLGLIALYGPGKLSIDSLVVRTLWRRFPELEGTRIGSYEGTPRVLIVGGGFGGVAAAKALRNTSCRVTLIDQRNYYLFQPDALSLAPRVKRASTREDAVERQFP
jgi:NADH:ubiquinone reductase (H+-translocating)